MGRCLFVFSSSHYIQEARLVLTSDNSFPYPSVRPSFVSFSSILSSLLVLLTSHFQRRELCATRLRQRTASAHPGSRVLWSMQASGLQRRQPLFVNRTPRDFDITALGPPPSPNTMLGPTGMALAPVIMGQLPSAVAVETESVRKPSTTILREDSILIEAEGVSRPDSWSMHYDRTDQAPYAESTDDNKMMTSTNLLHIPRDNPSHDLAFFLRTTGPLAPHRKPSKVEHPRRAVTAPQKALRFFRVGRQRSSAVRTDPDRCVLHPVKLPISARVPLT